MEGFWDAPLAGIQGQPLILFAAIHEEEIGRPFYEPQDGRLMYLWGLGAAELRVYLPVVRNPGEFLMRRQVPVVEQPEHWKEYSGNDYLGLQEHLQEEWDASEQVEDMDDEEETMHYTKTSSQDVDAMSFASQLVTKRDDSITDDCRLLKDIGSPSSSVATIGLQDDSAMPGASPAAFASILESVTTSEVQKLNI